MLILTDRAYSGWQAELDGKVVPIQLANGFTRAVNIPPGRHKVVFRYVPRSLFLGLSLSALGLLMLLYLAWETFSRPEESATIDPVY